MGGISGPTMDYITTLEAERDRLRERLNVYHDREQCLLDYADAIDNGEEFDTATLRNFAYVDPRIGSGPEDPTTRVGCTCDWDEDGNPLGGEHAPGCSMAAGPDSSGGEL